MTTNQFKPTLYDEKLSYVSKYGESLIETLLPKEGEHILDLGCGTGDLTNQIALKGANVVGVDGSNEMLEHARGKYANIPFYHGQAETFQVAEPYDAIFSNATLHWIKDAESVVRSMNDALNTSGRLVVEFGGKGNIETLLHGVATVIKNETGVNFDTLNPWYFPSISEYTTLLENNGFEVVDAMLYDRPTELPDGMGGLRHWLDSFADDFFMGIKDKNDIYQKIGQLLEDQLFIQDRWVLDYRRIRVVAVKI